MLELNRIYNMDCLEGMKELPSGSIDLIITDPPYYRIMISDYTGKKYDWDNQWESFEDYLKWVTTWLKECYRILKHNGSIYVFADDKRVSYTHIEMEKLGYYLENHIVWMKPNNMTIKGWNNYNCYAPITERILFCSKEHRTRNLENRFYSETIKAFSSIIEYMIEQKQIVKKIKGFETDKDFNDYINRITDTSSVVSRHYFTYSQWCFPTEELYLKLQSINNEVFQKEYEELKKEYEELKKEYEELKKEYEELLRTFQPKKNYTDVWNFNITLSSDKTYHPTQKPIELIRRIIRTSSKEGDIVLDIFIGSGTTPVACKHLNRNYIGFEISSDYCQIANSRLAQQTLWESVA
ncbi:MAG: site-specific DNA-methyltransferase [Desulfobacteraceae bacterium]|nr:site-specific DNA-methyltransferase [Desulfobacteraceae bacterium]